MTLLYNDPISSIRAISMSKDIVIKSNRLNTATQNLSLAEVRIMQLAIIDGRETQAGLTTDKPLTISSSRYAEAFDVSRQTAWEVIQTSVQTLFERRFSFLDDKDRLVKSRWVQRIRYLENESSIEIILTYDVVNEITRLDGYEQFFTQYLLEQTANMNSVYAVRLYELLKQWQKAKKTPLFKLDIFREQLGVANEEYKIMSDFKKRVLNIAVDEINEKSDLKVSYEQKKQGRKIIGFEFKVLTKNKPKQPKQDDNGRDENTPDLFHQLTEKQINYFGAKLANDSAFGSKHAKVGEDTKAFEHRIKQELKEPSNQKKWADDLKRLGYNPTKKGE